MIKARIGQRESEDWKERLLEKPKLWMYRLLKSDLIFEDYLVEIPELKYRRVLTAERRYERPQDRNWPVESGGIVTEKTCLACAQELVEDEYHVLLDCISYELLTRRMFREIWNLTGDAYQMTHMRDDDEHWMIEMLLGQG